MRVLLTAPFVGEIGWELLSWQGRVRRVFRHGGFDKLVVLGSAGKSAFYADMPLEYRAIDMSGLPGEAYENRRTLVVPHQPIAGEVLRAAVSSWVENAEQELRAGGATVETLWPDYAGRIWPCDEEHQAFIRFERPTREPLPPPWVVFVQRTRRFRAEDNWTAEHWDDLRGRLEHRGIHCSVYPDEAEAAMAVLSGCDLAFGQSTGGLHLAALCGCPAVVWSLDDSHLMTPWQITNRQRYQTHWNPLGTPVEFHGIVGWPTPELAADWICHGLEHIGRRTGTRLGTASFRCRWRTRAFIDWAIVRRPGFNRWPWPVQRFVRYVLV